MASRHLERDGSADRRVGVDQGATVGEGHQETGGDERRAGPRTDRGERRAQRLGGRRRGAHDGSFDRSGPDQSGGEVQRIGEPPRALGRRDVAGQEPNFERGSRAGCLGRRDGERLAGDGVQRTRIAGDRVGIAQEKRTGRSRRAERSRPARRIRVVVPLGEHDPTELAPSLGAQAVERRGGIRRKKFETKTADQFLEAGVEAGVPADVAEGARRLCDAGRQRRLDSSMT